MGLQDKVNTAKEVLGDTKSRMVVIFLSIIVIVVLTVAYVKFKRSKMPPAGMASSMVGVPSISSIPGMGNPTREYAKLQERQNVQLAREATRTGTSAMPTVIRTTYLDSGVSTDLSQQSGAASAAGCGVEELKRAHASGVSVSELRCRGCSLASLRSAGFASGELRSAGFSAQELKDAGFSATELKAAGFTAAELSSAGYSIKDLVAASYTIGELKNASFSVTDLHNAGFSDEAIQAAGFGTTNMSSTGECDAKKLQDARSRGIGASELKKLGCSITALRMAGYTAAELKAAGFSASALKSAGFSVTDLRSAGFSSTNLRDAGFSVKELKDAGFSAADLKSAGFSAGELRNAGFSAGDLKDAGFGTAELKSAGFTATELTGVGFTSSELQAAGYTKGDLIRAGVIGDFGNVEGANTAEDSCSVASLKKARVSGLSATGLKNRGCSASVLKAAGFTASEIKAAGFNLAELKGAGFITSELKDSGYLSATDSGVCSRDKLKKAHASGVSATELKNSGCNADDLKAAGFDAKELYAAGFSADNLKDAGFSHKEIQVAKFLAEHADSGKESGLQNSLGRLSDAELSDMSDEELNNLKRQLQAKYTTQANQLIAAWTPIPTQNFVQGVAESAARSSSNEEGKTPKDSKEKPAVDFKNSDVYKAGNIILAVLDTEVNSDETAPVMATIVQGSLKGSKAVGNFTLTGGKLLLKFSTLSVPRLDSSVSFNAVAVDPDTSKPGLASSVDNHYLLRYGSILGTGFVQGLGQAVSTSGAQVQTTTTGTLTNQGTMSTLGKTIAAFGTAAQQLGTAMSDKINTPPTVKLKAGISIGLLLMADLVVPKEKKNRVIE